MAVTTRDVMFILRAQDYATRDVNRLSATFGRLGRELRQVDRAMKEGIGRSQQQMTREVERSRDAFRSVNHELGRQNDAISKQNAQYKESLRNLRMGNDASKEGSRLAKQRIGDAQKEIAATKQQIATQRQMFDTNAEGYRRMSASQERDVRKSIATNERLVASREKEVQQLRRSAAAYDGHATRRDKEIARIEKTIDRNGVLSASNKEQINDARRLAETEQETAKRRHAIREADARREAEIHRQRIARQQEFAQRTMAAGAAMTLAGAIAVAVGARTLNAFWDMTMAAAEFRQEIALAQTQTDGISASLGQLTGVALRVAREIPAAMDTIPGTLYDIFSSMDVNLQEAEYLLQGFAKEAVGGNASIQDSARSTIAILNGMQLSVSDLTRVQDTQFQTVRKGVIDYEEYSKVIGRMIPALQRTNQEIETGGAMLAFLTRNGLSARMASTAAARALELIGDPRVVNRMEALGMSMRDASGNLLPLVDILRQLADEVGNLPAPERAQRLLDIFGGAGYRIQARRFFDTVLPAFAEFEKHIQWQIDNGGSLEDAYDIMFDQPINKITLLQNNWESLRQEIGQGFFGVLNVLVERMKVVVDWFANLDEETKNSIIEWAAFAGVALTVGGALTVLIGLFTTLLGLIVSMGPSIAASLGIMSGGVVIIGALSAAAAALVLNTEGVTGLWDDLGRIIESASGKLGVATVGMGALTVAMILYARAVGPGVSLSAAFASSLNLLVLRARVALLTLQGFALAHPVILALVAVTTLLAGAWAIANRRAKEFNEGVTNYVDGMQEASKAALEGIEGIEGYAGAIDESIAKTAEQVLKEKELYQVIVDNNRLRTSDVINGIVAEGEARQETLKIIDEETKAAQEQETIFERLQNNIVGLSNADAQRRKELENLRDEYSLQIEMAEEARRVELERMRDQGGFSQLVAEYTTLREQANSADADTARMAAAGAANRKEQILGLLEMKGALEGYTEEQKEAMLISGDFDEELQEMASASEIAQQRISDLASAIAGATDPMGLYNEKISEINDANRKMAESTAEATDDAEDSWEDYYSEVEDSAQAFFAAQEQQLVDQRAWFDNLNEIREQGHEAYADYLTKLGPEQAGLIADIAKQSEDEIASAADTHRQLQIDNARMQVQVFASEYGSIIDETGNISEEAMEAMQESLSIAPGIMEEILFDVETVTGLQLESIEEQFGEYSRNAAQRMIDNMEWGNEELATLMQIMASTGGEGGRKTAEAIAEELDIGVGEVNRIMAGYAQSQVHGLNPLLQALGKTPIRLHYNPRESLYGSLGLNAGGPVPGRGPNRDSVLTALTPGEFVLRRQAVDNLDLHTLHELNRTGDINTLVRKYNAGGFVTASDIPKPPNDYRPPVDPFTRPAHGTAETMYDAAVDFMNLYAPPLSTGVGWSTMWEAVSRRFPSVGLHSAFRPGAITATGNPSYHGQGRAIDISPRMDVFNWLAQHYGNSRELIFSPAGNRQVHNGRSHMYTGITRAQHFDHIHWAMANGGIINEPIIGRGLRSGHSYSFGERGPETVIPGVGDGPGLTLPDLGNRGTPSTSDLLGNNRSNPYTGDVFGITNWMSKFAPKYSDTMMRSTEQNIQATRDMLSAVGAMGTHFNAQHALADARTEMEHLANRSIMYANEVERAELALEQAQAHAAKITAEEEQAILAAKQRVRDAEWGVDEASRGIHSLNNELAVLQQQSRIDDMRESLEAMRSGGQNAEELADQLERVKDAQAAVDMATANVTMAQFEVAREGTLPSTGSEVQDLLRRYKAEKGLADTQAVLTENRATLAEELDKYNGIQQDTTASARELRIAEIELMLAENQLLALQRERNYESEEQYNAELQLRVARDALTQAHASAIGPTQQVQEAQDRLTEAQDRQRGSADALRAAQLAVSQAEMAAMQATLGLIEAGQALTAHGPEQFAYFTQLAETVGISDQSVRNLISSLNQLSGTSANYEGAVGAHEGWDKVAVEGGFQDTYNRAKEVFDNRRVSIATATESERERLTRIVYEIMSGQRTMNDLRTSVNRLKDLGIGVYDSGGIWPSGKLGVNLSGKDEYVFTDTQLGRMGGDTITIESGAIQLNVEGGVDSATLPQVEGMLTDAVDQLIDSLRR